MFTSLNVISKERTDVPFIFALGFDEDSWNVSLGICMFTVPSVLLTQIPD